MSEEKYKRTPMLDSWIESAYGEWGKDASTFESEIVSIEQELKQAQERIAELEKEREWVSPYIIQPQVGFEVLCCCGDDVFTAIYRVNSFDDGYFEDIYGKTIKVDGWKDLPKPA